MSKKMSEEAYVQLAIALILIHGYEAADEDIVIYQILAAFGAVRCLDTYQEVKDAVQEVLAADSFPEPTVDLERPVCGGHIPRYGQELKSEYGQAVLHLAHAAEQAATSFFDRGSYRRNLDNWASGMLEVVYMESEKTPPPITKFRHLAQCFGREDD